MKTKLLLSALLSFVFCLLSSQVPLGFNYQAIARDGVGVIIANTALPVKITIQTSTGTVIYEELFSSVTSNQFGLISIVVGTGTWQSGSAATFSAIDWKSQQLYLKTTIQYPGTTWTIMGTSQIWGVPYSLVAKEVAGPLTKLGITGTTSDMEEALFEVKNQAGNTVFAVYNEGIRAYVGNGDAKGKRGGFAVGGYDATKGSGTIYDLFTLNTDSARIYVDSKPNLKGARGGFSVGGYDMTKGTFQDYLNVSKDSVRIYIDSNPLTKGKRGGFAVGGYDMTKGTNDNYMNVNTDASGIINPSQNRILWYPIKNAFLTGKVLVEDKDSVGINSFASGYESKAEGQYSQALGYQAIARGNYSTSIGYQSVANKDNSFAFGQWAQANNQESYAFGRGAIAGGFRSFAFGSAGVDRSGNTTGVAYAKGDYSFAIGQGSQTFGFGSIALGISSRANNDFSFALGLGSVASGIASVAIGLETSSSGIASTAIGQLSQANGINSIAMGYTSLAIGVNSIAMGNGSNAIGQNSFAVGPSAYALGHESFAMGTHVKSIGDQSYTFGNFTTAKGPSSTATGYWTTAIPYGSFVIGQYNDTTCSDYGRNYWFSPDPLLIAGNGSYDKTSNALTLYKNGNMTIAGTLTQNSDARLKEKMTPLSNLLDKIAKIQPISFEFKDKQTHPVGRHIGFIAQEVQQVFPELVSQDGQGYLSVEYGNFSAVLLQAIKEQQKQIIEQQQQIESQQKEIDDLKTLVNSLIANQTAQVNK